MMDQIDDRALRSYLGNLPFKVRRELVTTIREEADKLADAVKAAAPIESGALRDSVQVRRKRNELDLEVTAGGESTTKEVREGSGRPYDYSLAVEFGTAARPAEPFFFSTARRLQPQIRKNINAAVARALK